MVMLLLPSDSLSGSWSTKEIFLSGWSPPAIDCRLWAEVCECPMELKAMLHRRFASLYIFSQGAVFSLAANFEALGSV